MRKRTTPCLVGAFFHVAPQLLHAGAVRCYRAATHNVRATPRRVLQQQQPLLFDAVLVDPSDVVVWNLVDHNGTVRNNISGRQPSGTVGNLIMGNHHGVRVHVGEDSWEDLVAADAAAGVLLRQCQ